MNEDWRNELITKGAAFDAQEVHMAIRPLDGYEDGLAMLDILRNLPPAQPQRIKGRWIPFDIPWYQCSECGAIRENKTFMENFCPNCGADMRGEEDE